MRIHNDNNCDVASCGGCVEQQNCCTSPRASTFSALFLVTMINIFGRVVVVTSTEATEVRNPPLFNEYMIKLRNHHHRTDILPFLLQSNLREYSETEISSMQQQLNHNTGNKPNNPLRSEQGAATTPTTPTTIRRRDLFLFGAGTGNACSLTTEQFDFIYDPVSQLYVWDGIVTTTNLNDNNDIDNLKIWNSTGFGQPGWDTTTTTTNTTGGSTTSDTTDSSKVSVRACLCPQYINRPIEFCAAEFVSCSVRTVPVSCFTSSSTDSFIQSVWPVLMFWMLVIVYVWSCSDPGRIARQYYYRKFRCCFRRQQRRQQPVPQIPPPQYPLTTSATEQPVDDGQQQQQTVNTTEFLSEGEIIRQQLNDIVENYPSRASYMYREAMNRQSRLEQYEQTRQSNRWHRTYQHMNVSMTRFICFWTSSSNTSHIDANNNNNNNNSNSNHVVPGSIGDIAVPNDLTVHTPQRPTSSPPFHEEDGMQTMRPRLLLKTKIFYYGDVTINNNSTSTCNDVLQREQQSAQQQQQQHSECAATTNGPALIESGPHIDDDDDEDEMNNAGSDTTIRCAICLLPLQEGIDVIGDLPCRHCMHKHCLKEWLQRKNRCPLCQLSDIALYQGSNDTNHTNTNQQL